MISPAGSPFSRLYRNLPGSAFPIVLAFKFALCFTDLTCTAFKVTSKTANAAREIIIMVISSVRKSASFLIITFFITFLFIAGACAQPDKKSRTLIGGPCKYKSYAGQATILSLAENQTGERDKAGRFEVKFSFTTPKKIEEEFAQVEGKIFYLYGNNFQYPDKDFISSNQLQVGKALDGNMQVIISGTCTPVLFDFSGLEKKE
jgi:hypothetical protein